MTSVLDLDQSQAQALDQIQTWMNDRFRDPKQPQVFRLGGHAGSGKTTLISEVVRRCDITGIRYALATFSGKAADVLRRKGLGAAQTIHSLIYVPNQQAIAEAQEIQKTLTRDLSVEDRAVLVAQLKRWRDLSWRPRTSLEHIDLLIIDEASMVSGKMTNQLKAFGRPILAVGDPAQLPPVQKSISEPLFYRQQPDAQLEGKHRFGSHKVLGDAALAARTNTPVPDSLIRPLGEVDVLDFDVVLVHSNKARWRFIHEVRAKRGLPLDQPVPGDRITFWHNNYDSGVFNGGSAIVNTITEAPEKASKHPAWAVEAETDIGEQLSLLVDKRGFLEQTALDAAVRKTDCVVASFSEALTVHKAQGSEWPRVLVAQHPSHNFRGMPGEDKIRWRYTAVTRASETLVLADPAFSAAIRVR